jgi:hypothetical protein
MQVEALAHDEDQSMKRSRFSEEQIIGILRQHYRKREMSAVTRFAKGGADIFNQNPIVVPKACWHPNGESLVKFYGHFWICSWIVDRFLTNPPLGLSRKGSSVML